MSSANTWICKSCTLINKANRSSCDVCKTSRHRLKNRGTAIKRNTLSLETVRSKKRAKTKLQELSKNVSSYQASEMSKGGLMKFLKTDEKGSNQQVTTGAKKDKASRIVLGGAENKVGGNDSSTIPKSLASTKSFNVEYCFDDKDLKDLTQMNKEANTKECSSGVIDLVSDSHGIFNSSQDCNNRRNSISSEIKQTQIKSRRYASSAAMHERATEIIPTDTLTLNEMNCSSSKIDESDVNNIMPIKNTVHVKESIVQSKLVRCKELMTKKFKIKALRNLQPVAVEGALRGKHQIIVMATGGGKSLCYQLPALVSKGVTIVISPLIALMIDQCNNLKQKVGENSCALLSSANKEKENKAILQSLEERCKKCLDIDGLLGANKRLKLKEIKLLYCTPEMIETAHFRGTLKRLHRSKLLSLIAIDEAHCLSCWGHSFRPAYLKLSWIRKEFPRVPCMACTATATKKVISDIKTFLCFGDDALCHTSSFNRSNINYEVRFKDYLDSKEAGAIGDLVELVRSQHNGEGLCAGIIYVHKRDDSDSIARRISSEAGIKALAYHAGMKDVERSETQNRWTSGEIKVVVATVAFGMGIDLAHVRYVIHWCIPKTIEGFYQESGRAGRDGLPSKSILYYSKDDASKLSYIIRRSAESKTNSTRGDIEHQRSLDSLENMVKYCESSKCRRQFILKYFGENIDVNVCNKTCDVCMCPSKVKIMMKSARAMKHAYTNVLFMQRARQKEKAWDGQWENPIGDTSDCESDLEVEFDNNDGLSIFGEGSKKKFRKEKSSSTNYYSNRKKGHMSSKGRIEANILSKYEVSPYRTLAF